MKELNIKTEAREMRAQPLRYTGWSSCILPSVIPVPIFFTAILVDYISVMRFRVKLSDCFTHEQAAEELHYLWTRLGISPGDISTRTTERTTMAHLRHFSASSFSPKAWGGINSLVGDSSKIDHHVSAWRDGFIVNLGTPAGHGKVVKPQDLKGWHIDGDNFVHYLDSSEQALLTIPLWTDVPPGGGGTMLCPRGIDVIARYLYEHPEGVTPLISTRAENPKLEEEKYGYKCFNKLAASMPDEAFVEAIGVVGDIYLLHPLILHSATNNQLRTVRVITNPPIRMTEPFMLDREDGNYCPMEKKILRALGKESLKGWKIQGPRQRLVPARERRETEMRREEETRLAKLQVADNLISDVSGSINVASVKHL
ncbi:hypothetical protein BJ170DRAFT_703920 [Xylariales sp. AK1849]|nr:hypothetical protein BJ170DRAFT_703920 [Xylariales sp. AK1849]